MIERFGLRLAGGAGVARRPVRLRRVSRLTGIPVTAAGGAHGTGDGGEESGRTFVADGPDPESV